MPPKRFWFLVKVKNFISNKRCGSRKTKECKRRDHKTKLFEDIKKNIRQADFKALVLPLCYYCGDKVKYGLPSKNLFQRKQQHDGQEYFSVAINFYEKPQLLVLTWNKKHSSKQVVSVTHTLVKKFLAAATFEGL